MELNINSPVYFKDHYGIDDEVYKFCQRAYLFFKDKQSFSAVKLTPKYSNDHILTSQDKFSSGFSSCFFQKHTHQV